VKSVLGDTLLAGLAAEPTADAAGLLVIMDRVWKEVFAMTLGKAERSMQVHIGEGSNEYRNPAEFFRRTFLTESLKNLLIGALQRLSGEGGDPVVQLQTNFGGGKTHSMLALYHFFSGTPTSELLDVETLATEAEVKSIPKVKRVVLVGNKISPGNPSVKPDGTVVRTLWGELAHQLGGKKAYDRALPPTMKRPPVPETCCANFSTSMAPA